MKVQLFDWNCPIEAGQRLSYIFNLLKYDIPGGVLNQNCSSRSKCLLPSCVTWQARQEMFLDYRFLIKRYNTVINTFIFASSDNEITSVYDTK